MSFDTNFYEVRSIQSVNRKNFTGSINFDFITPFEKRLDNSECYSAIKYKITQIDNAGNAGPLRPALDANGHLYIPYLNPNYPLLNFNSIYTQLSGKQISEIIDPAIAVTMYENCFLSRSELDSKDALTLNRQIKKSESVSIINSLLGNLVAVPTSTALPISATATSSSYPFYVTAGNYSYSGVITATFTAHVASGDVNTNAFVLTATDNTTENVYLFKIPAITNGATIVQDTSCTFKAIVNVMATAIPLNFKDNDKRIQYALAQQGEFAKGTTQQVNFRIPTALFMSKGYIPQNAQIVMRWNINNNFQHEMIGCYNTKPAIYNSITVPSTGQPNNSILIEVLDFRLFMRAETMPNALSLYKIPLIQMTTMYRTIMASGNTSYTFNMPPMHITYLILGFVQQGRGSAGKFSGTDFSSGFTSAFPEVKTAEDASTNVVNVRVLWGGVVKPQPDYIIDFAGLSDTNDNTRPWSDFVSLIESRADRSASAYDYDMWQNAPLFVYKFAKNTTADNNVQITVNMAANYVANTSQLFVTALYNEDLLLNYGPDAKITDISLTYD